MSGPGHDGPTPITLRNLHRWALDTYRPDKRDHRGKGGSLTPLRLARAVWPRLSDAIFVVGAARSGTTFLGECLGALPEVGYHHEPVAAKAAARYVYEGRWGFLHARAFFHEVYAWLARVHLEGHLRFAAKNPTDCFIVAFLARAFPDAQFVHIVRDGRDAALSDSKKPWLAAASAGSGRREPGGYPYGPGARFWVEPGREVEFEAVSDLRRCAWAWRRYVEAALAAGPSLGPRRWHEVRYEALCAAPAREGERILDFLGVTAPASRAAFLDAVAQADARSVGAWARELTPLQVAEIEAEAGPTLRRLGYA